MRKISSFVAKKNRRKRNIIVKKKKERIFMEDELFKEWYLRISKLFRKSYLFSTYFHHCFYAVFQLFQNLFSVEENNFQKMVELERLA